VAREPLTIETPREQWAYAAHFCVGPPGGATQVEVVADVEVMRGEVGIGLLNLDGSRFIVERHVGADDGRTTVRLVVGPKQYTDRVVIRNVGDSGVSAAVSVHNLDVRTDAPPGDPRVPRIALSSELFHRFRAFSGRVPPGFFVNWLGVLTRSTVWPFPPDIQALYARDRDEQAKYPLDDEHVLDWVPLLEAVVSSRGRFRMVALGAGWGRWLTAGAFAARQLGLTFHITGVEAEPDHLAWMQQHMQDNSIPPQSYRLVHGAAAATPEPCWFPVASPEWYGQSIVATDATAAADPGQDEIVVRDRRLRKVQSVTIEHVISGDAIVDYLHMDIQGTEYGFLSRDPDRLRRYVRVVNVGTHSDAIERRLRRLFEKLGWQSRYDVQIGTQADLMLDGQMVARVEFGDGVQVWSNPLLSHNESGCRTIPAG
jgi:FkbM family methyltransferase